MSSQIKFIIHTHIKQQEGPSASLNIKQLPSKILCSMCLQLNTQTCSNDWFWLI